MLWQVGKLGPHYLTWVHSPVDRPLRIFQSDFWELFTRTPWYVVPIVWLPVVLYFAFLAIHELENRVGNVSSDRIQFRTEVVPTFCVEFVVGCFIWSLIEYCLHRFLFHLLPPPNSPWRITFHFFIHGQHHKVGNCLGTLFCSH